jgi:molecular chaperone HtpG
VNLFLKKELGKTMTTGTLKIHTENILPIIKKWLYSDKDIFVRELVSNACDAIQKCKVLREHAELSTPDEEFRIDIRIDKNTRTLIFLDNGIGMTSEEVEKYIAQVAFSGAEEFIAKYSSQNEKDQIIGHFGLGFYSSYMVAEKVAIDTLSYRPHSTPVLWSCDGSSSYTLDRGAKETRGTEITLLIAKESEEFLEEPRLRQILQHYCAFLPFPIYLNGSQINKKQPLWMKNASECSDAEYIDFYHTLYPLESDPIFWIHLNVDYPFHLKGILYFPKITRRFDWGQNSIKLFCNRVFVSDNCKDLIPDYLMVLRGAIDSPDIPLNVSRSTLQMDRTVRQLSQHISKKITDKLSSLYTADREKFCAFWPDIEMIIKLGMLQDDKFYERSKDFLVWKTLSGEWTTAAEYIERHKDTYKGKVFYTAEDQKQSHVLDLYAQKGVEILIASSMVDTPIISLLESKLDSVKFQRIDSTIDEAILDSSREKTLLDSDGKTESFKIAHFIRSKLTTNNVEVEAKSLHDDSVPALLIVDEEMRRMRETMTLAQHQLPLDLAAKRTFVVNTNNKLIQSVYHLKEKDPVLAQEMVHHLYELSLLAQRELDPSSLSQFVARSNRILEKMTQQS